MKTLYFDCKNGICIDMVLMALKDIIRPDGIEDSFFENLEKDHLCHGHHHDYCHGHCNGNHHHEEHHHGEANGHHPHHDEEGSHHHGKSYKEICHLIEHAHISDTAKKIVLDIYEVIAMAEATVHGDTLDTVHFHEVGREEAVANIIKIALCLEKIAPEKIFCSEIHDGKGFIECSHGRIPVPVPAVCEIKKLPKAISQGHKYVTVDVETEMVTPSGLGILVGIGACNAEKPDTEPLATAEGFGTRDTGRGGMSVSLYNL